MQVFMTAAFSVEHENLHLDNTPMQCTVIYNGCKNGYFLDKKKSDIYIVFARKIDWGYTLEPPQW